VKEEPVKDQVDDIESTPDSRTKDIVIERELDAPATNVWQALTDATLVAKWWSPFPGIDAKVRQLEARPGGRAVITATPPQGETLDFILEYITVEAPRELAFTVRGKPTDQPSPAMKIHLRADGSRTHMRFESPDVPIEAHDDALGGWNAFFDKLERVVRSSGASGGATKA
jgi:uncharacterized protein YndB with AHSA1/START domain